MTTLPENRGFILETDIGEGPFFPNNQPPPNLTFDVLATHAKKLKSRHLSLASQYAKEECSEKFAGFMKCLTSREFFTNNFCIGLGNDWRNCDEETSARLNKKIDDWVRSNLRAYGKDLLPLFRNQENSGGGV